jgi:site-specific recombinase XerD
MESGTIRIDDSKGRVDRVVYFASDVERELRVWRARNPAQTYLFPSRKRKGLSLDRGVVNCMMSEYLRRAEVARRYSPHCLRHTFATQLLNAGAERLRAVKSKCRSRPIMKDDIAMEFIKLDHSLWVTKSGVKLDEVMIQV